MLKEIVEQFAVCHVFWAADFRQYSDAAEECYTEIPKISNYHLFVGCRADAFSGSNLKRYFVTCVEKVIITLNFRRFSRLTDTVFQRFDQGHATKLMVGVGCNSSLMVLPHSMWHLKVSLLRQITKIKTYEKIKGYPKPLKAKYLEQIGSVYLKCISPSQFLPQIFTTSNSADILKGGSHISEISLPLNKYLTFSDTSILQHCQYIFPTKQSAIDGHQQFIASLHATYPLTKRVTTLNNSNNTPQSNLAYKILPTNNDEDVNGTNQDIQKHLDYMLSENRLCDGIENISINSIIAVAPTRKNGIPWFARVVQILEGGEEFLVKWFDLDPDGSSKYCLLTESEDTVHADAIICNGVEFAPFFGEKLLWKLLTPLHFIQQLNQDEPAEIVQQRNRVRISPSHPKVNFTSLMFKDAESFKQYLTQSNF